MHRILLDTNILIAAAYNLHSASSRVVNRVQSGELSLIVSPAIKGEYERLFPRAVRSPQKQEWIWQVVGRADLATPEENPPVTEDRDDDKFLAAAVCGQADAIISNDQHLLSVHPYLGIDILQPARFLEQMGEDDHAED